MDLTIDVEDYKLNIRAAAVIIHNNKLLTHKSTLKDHYCLPGGRVEIGEKSEETVKRELQEELGKKVEVLDYLTTIENFFTSKDKKYHEIFFMYRVEFLSEEDKKIEYAMHNAEGKEYLEYRWLDIDKIEEYNIVPECLNDILKNKDIPIHIVNKGREDK